MKRTILKTTLVLFVCSCACVAQTLTGTVTNGTTGKPAAGDDVVLLTLSQGMEESGRTKTDASGNFSFELKEVGPHLVRVLHQGVNYFPAGGPITPNRSTTTITVYDSAPKVEGVAANVHVMRLQAPDNKMLQVIELIAVKNDSKPPRSLAGDRTWEVYLPEGAQIDEGAAQGPGGMPINAAPVPDEKHKGLYYFNFPLRPGESRFQIAYHLPYTGEVTLKPRVSGKLEHFALLMPKSMQFGAKVESNFSSMPDDTGQSTMEVATNVTPDKDLSFRVSGTGMLPDAQQQGSDQQGGAPGGQAAARPGGGLSTPEGTPDPLEKYRWPLLAVCLGALVIGGLWVVTKNQGGRPGTDVAAVARSMQVAVAAPAPAPAARAPSQLSSAPTLLLQALKEELFQLELDRQQGKISDAEYASAKAALDQTLARAITRAKQS
jgi:hypothetical protein